MNPRATIKVLKLAGKPYWTFCLYVADQIPRSMEAHENLKRFCEKEFPGRYTIKVIDVIANPKVARQENIVALPTLDRTAPGPMRRVIGNLSNTARLLWALDVRNPLYKSLS